MPTTRPEAPPQADAESHGHRVPQRLVQGSKSDTLQCLSIVESLLMLADGAVVEWPDVR